MPESVVTGVTTAASGSSEDVGGADGGPDGSDGRESSRHVEEQQQQHGKSSEELSQQQQQQQQQQQLEKETEPGGGGDLDGSQQHQGSAMLERDINYFEPRLARTGTRASFERRDFESFRSHSFASFGKGKVHEPRGLQVRYGYGFEVLLIWACPLIQGPC